MKKAYDCQTHSYKKKQQLQEFLYCREQSSKGIQKKFGISPSEEGYVLHLIDGHFRYTQEQLDIMLNAFQHATNYMCGKK